VLFRRDHGRRAGCAASRIESLTLRLRHKAAVGVGAEAAKREGHDVLHVVVVHRSGGTVGGEAIVAAAGIQGRQQAFGVVLPLTVEELSAVQRGAHFGGMRSGQAVEAAQALVEMIRVCVASAALRNAVVHAALDARERDAARVADDVLGGLRVDASHEP